MGFSEGDKEYLNTITLISLQLYWVYWISSGILFYNTFYYNLDNLIGIVYYVIIHMMQLLNQPYSTFY